MSLTSFLKQPEVKERFRREFNMPKLTAKKEIIAPPLSSRYALVGTAFDYLLRFHLQRLNPNTIRGQWVAEHAIHFLEEQAAVFPYDAVLATAHRVFNQAWIEHERFLSSGKLTDEFISSAIHLAQLDTILLKARRVSNQAWRERFLSSGKLTDELISNAIHLPQLDVVYHARYIEESLGTAFKEDIEDLRNLVSIVPPELFRTTNLCLLNPDFGDCTTTALMKGAKADLLIDDTLIDIKTTKKLGLRSDNFYQLLGYYTLHAIAGIGGITPKAEITKVAIYFSRHAHLESFDLSQFINAETFPGFVKWFSDSAEATF